ncbi:MAG: hypothetical protein KGI00_03080 [Candidatus Micrarchaeota archaeon]|nr:hypothetical protein [Candidatus Micrarchaeota archaeon]MDE1824378.1 hypothetical protein [Candidatus Micrarchaeota archaeon]MDE1849688.1 hypothetical protein [Candidatus Micrarchaeota archaeon]
MAKKKSFLGFLEVETVVTIALIAILAYIFYQNVRLQYSLISLQNSFLSLQSSYSHAEAQLMNDSKSIAGLQSSYNTLLDKYNESIYNRTHKSTITIFSNFSLLLPAAYFNQLNVSAGKGSPSGSWQYANFTYFYNASCPGYFLFNATPRTGSSFSFITVSLSQSKPVQKFGKAIANASFSFSPISGKDFVIPAIEGPNYFVINNANTTEAEGLTFNLSFVHTVC